MVLALKRFEESILKDETLAGTGYLIINREVAQQADFSQTQATLRNILANGLDYEPLTTTKLYTQNDGEFSNAQGFCTDGEFVYIVMRAGSSET